MNFNLIPYDTEAYLIAADYAEENGCLLPNAIRNKKLPLDIENGKGWGMLDAFGGFYYTEQSEGCGISHYIFGDFGHGLCWGYGSGTSYKYIQNSLYDSGYGFGFGSGEECS